ncbi:DNA adenine methylase [Campylobacter californiensis]|uniref:DNA adenine methylase n=1 Tax=Campylobacter californiensis TaxID=1032243 RepID=UPI00145117BA|nr:MULTISPECIES: DNA adenine methylase [unclassified Campylobacter]QCD50994.1 adenine-specific DNA methyltransferase [Campylobacter sp. RM6914]
MKIHQRRYLGNKFKILPFIGEIVQNEIGNFAEFCDIFAGSGVVGEYFNKPDNKIISNDLLYHNFVNLNTFLGIEKFDESKILEILKKLNVLKSKKDNYFSSNFGNFYFSLENAVKIGLIREEIENLYKAKKINEQEKFILITSLIYAIDKIANTVGHYDAYIKKEIKERKFELLLPQINRQNNKENEIYKLDANELIKRISCEVLYLDPPYNSRQYSDSYHLLENLALWSKPQVFGVAKKFDRSKIKSGYSGVNATKLFADLVQNAKCKFILFSYNNMANKGNHRSNAKISDEDIVRILGARGKVKIFEQKHREFNVGNTRRDNNFERVFFVKVDK